MSYLGRKSGRAALISDDIPDNSITAAKIVADTIAAGDLAPNSVDSSELVDGSVDNSHLADNAVDTAEIADNAVTLAKMAGGTDGNLITYDTSGDPAYVETGTSGYVLTSAGADAVPAFAALPASGLTTAVGTITAASSLTTAVDQSLSFTPTSVIFFFASEVDSDSIGMGFCGPNDENQTCFIKTLIGDPHAHQSGSYAIQVQTGASTSNRATCTLGTDKFTLTWTKVGSPAVGDNYIKYMAMK